MYDQQITPLKSPQGTLKYNTQAKVQRSSDLSPAYGIIDPDYATIFTKARILAWQYGFALMMHGSFTRDLDLLLVPWTDTATDDSVPRIVAMLAESCGLHIQATPSLRPHGRTTYTLIFSKFGDPRWVDLSVMPCQKKGV